MHYTIVAWKSRYIPASFPALALMRQHDTSRDFPRLKAAKASPAAVLLLRPAAAFVIEPLIPRQWASANVISPPRMGFHYALMDNTICSYAFFQRGIEKKKHLMVHLRCSLLMYLFLLEFFFFIIMEQLYSDD